MKISKGIFLHRKQDPLVTIANAVQAIRFDIVGEYLINNECQEGTLNFAVFEVLKKRPESLRTWAWIASQIIDQGLLDEHVLNAIEAETRLSQSIDSGETLFRKVRQEGSDNFLFGLHDRFWKE